MSHLSRWSCHLQFNQCMHSFFFFKLSLIYVVKNWNERWAAQLSRNWIQDFGLFTAGFFATTYHTYAIFVGQELGEEMGAAKLSEIPLKRLWGRKISLFLLLSVSPWQLKAVEVLMMKRMKFISEAERILILMGLKTVPTECVDLMSLLSLDAKSITQKLFCRIFFA